MVRELAAFEAWADQAGLPADPNDPLSVYGYLVTIADEKALATVLKIGAVLYATAKERGGAFGVHGRRCERANRRTSLWVTFGSRPMRTNPNIGEHPRAAQSHVK